MSKHSDDEDRVSWREWAAIPLACVLAYLTVGALAAALYFALDARGIFLFASVRAIVTFNTSFIVLGGFVWAVYTRLLMREYFQPARLAGIAFGTFLSA